MKHILIITMQTRTTVHTASIDFDTQEAATRAASRHQDSLDTRRAEAPHLWCTFTVMPKGQTVPQGATEQAAREADHGSDGMDHAFDDVPCIDVASSDQRQGVT